MNDGTSQASDIAREGIHAHVGCVHAAVHCLVPCGACLVNT